MALASLTIAASAEIKTYTIFGTEYRMKEKAFNKGMELAEESWPLSKKYGPNCADTAEGQEIGNKFVKVLTTEGYSQEDIQDIIRVMISRVIQLAFADAFKGAAK